MVTTASMSVFPFKRSKPRKEVSKSPLKLSAEQSYREFGPLDGFIDLNIADRKLVFDVTSGNWNTADAEVLDGSASNLTREARKHVQTLQEENNILKLKFEVLFNLVAESIAELFPASH